MRVKTWNRCRCFLNLCIMLHQIMLINRILIDKDVIKGVKDIEKLDLVSSEIPIYIKFSFFGLFIIASCCCILRIYYKFMLFYFVIDFCLGVWLFAGILIQYNSTIGKAVIELCFVIFVGAMCLVDLFGLALYKHDPDDPDVLYDRLLYNERIINGNNRANYGSYSRTPAVHRGFNQKGAPRNFAIGGIEQRHVVIPDGQGGFIIIIKEVAAEITQNAAGNSVTSIDQTTLAHVTLEALLRNPQNPAIRTISATEISHANLSPADRAQLQRAITN